MVLLQISVSECVCCIELAIKANQLCVRSYPVTVKRGRDNAGNWNSQFCGVSISISICS